MASPFVSVILPVYNEGESIVPRVRTLAEALSPYSYEILIVYDFPEDATLPAAKRLRQENAQIHPILNDFGKGVANALKKGFSVAKGEAVLVTMADGSDRTSDIPLMIQEFENGADIICPSRYMKGGLQIGGGAIKSTLSRLAGLSLFHLAGLPTRDPTSNFKLYRADFLKETPIESRGGFEIALELTVKAKAKGKKIVEIPTVWRDRTEGTSKFRLLKWLPHYLKWYFYGFRTKPAPQKSHLAFSIFFSLVCFAALIYFFSPRLFTWPGLYQGTDALSQPETRRAYYTLLQLQDPFAPIPTISDVAIQWRLFFPLLAHQLNLPPNFYFALPHLGCFLFLGLIIWLTRKNGVDPLYAALSGFIFGSASWFFVSTGWLGYFDSWLILSLTLVAFIKPRPILALACLIGPWIDERFVFGAPLALFARRFWFSFARPLETGFFWKDLKVGLSCLAVYPALRLVFLLAGRDLSTGDYLPYALASIKDPATFLKGIWHGLRSSLIFIVAAFFFGFRRSRKGAAFFLGATFFILGTLFVLAGDVARSFNLLIPVGLFGFLAWHHLQPKSAKVATLVALAWALALPAKHVVKSFSLEIHPFIQEWGRYKHKPQSLTPEELIKQGVEKARSGDENGALNKLTQAIHLRRSNPLGYFYRGQIYAKQGKRDLATQEFKRALDIAPPDWPYRQSAEQKLKTLSRN